MILYWKPPGVVVRPDVADHPDHALPGYKASNA